MYLLMIVYVEIMKKKKKKNILGLILAHLVQI